MSASIGNEEVAPILHFAIGLAREELNPLKPQRRGALVSGFLHALGRESKGVWGRRAGTMVHSSFRDKRPESFEQPDFEELQRAIRELLGTVRSNAIRAMALPSLRFVLLPGKKRRQLQVAGTARDVFSYLLHAALAICDADVVRFCPACGGPFLAQGKRRFCDRACANRAMYRRWSQRHGRADVGVKNRATYQRKHPLQKVSTYQPRRPR